MIRRRTSPAASPRQRPGGPASRRLLLPGISAATLAGLAWVVLQLLRSPGAPDVLRPSDPVAALLLDSEGVRFALWSERPDQLLEELVPLLGMERRRLRRALQGTEGGLWFDRLERDLARLRVRQLALRQEADGSWEVRLEVPRLRAWLVRAIGVLRKDPLMAGGPVGDRGAAVRWQGSVWSARSEVEIASAVTVAGRTGRPGGRLEALDRQGAEVLVRRLRGSGESAIYRLCPPHREVRPDGSHRRSVALQRVGGCKARTETGAPSSPSGLPAQMMEMVQQLPDVFLVALRREPLADQPADALLLLEQERLPNVTQLPSACSVGWNGARRALPGARLEGVLDVRVYEQEMDPSFGADRADRAVRAVRAVGTAGAAASVRAYDRASQEACIELEAPMANLLEGLAGEELIWVELSLFARWLSDYVRVLDEFRVLPRRWRGSSRWVELAVSAIEPDTHLLFVEHDGVSFWQVDRSASASPSH